jgi:hypothetical protein
MKRGIRVWTLLVVTGCGSATPAPQAADEELSEAQPAESEPQAGDHEGAEPEDSKSDSAGSDEASASSEADSEPLSGEDLSAVLQQVLDDPALEQHLHTDKPGRAPVKMSGPDLPEDLKVNKAGYGVKIVDEPKSDKDPVLVLTRVERSGNIVTVAYRYAVEGIRGTTRVKKGSSGWELMSSRIMQ